MFTKVTTLTVRNSVVQTDVYQGKSFDCTQLGSPNRCLQSRLLRPFNKSLTPHFTTTFSDIANIMISYFMAFRSRDSSDGIEIRYGLEGPGIESRWGRDFPHLSRPALRPTQLPVQWVPGLSRGKGGRGVVLTTHRHLVCRCSKEKSRAIALPSLKGPRGL